MRCGKGHQHEDTAAVRACYGISDPDGDLAARLRRSGVLLCLRPGARLTEGDVTAAEAFAAWLRQHAQDRDR